jgi:formylglycine-generating enzyme required for sulfatase activity
MLNGVISFRAFAIVGLVTLLPLPFAFAQPAPAGSAQGGAVASPAASPAAPPPAVLGSAAPSSAGAAGAASPAATPPVHADSEGDDADKDKPPSTTAVRPAPLARQPVAFKDGMVRVGGGRFTVGSNDRTAPANERPARVVVVAPFWIDRTEVAVGAYRACVEKAVCPVLPKTSPMCTYDQGDPLLPISCVPWSAAQAYCSSIGRRLPREVEWEVAARGTSGVRGGTPSCGVAATLVHEITSRSCSGKRPSRVGTHLAGASPFGVLDMTGNVEEWVADWYSDSIADLSPRAGASHVLRGGGWLSQPSVARTTSRNWGSVREAGPNVGFRCARDD